MPTFLAGFCAPGCLLQNPYGFHLKNSPHPGDQRSPWEFQKVTPLKIICLGMRTFLAGFLRSSSKSRRDFKKFKEHSFLETIILTNCIWHAVLKVFSQDEVFPAHPSIDSRSAPGIEYIIGCSIG